MSASRLSGMDCAALAQRRTLADNTFQAHTRRYRCRCCRGREKTYPDAWPGQVCYDGKAYWLFFVLVSDFAGSLALGVDEDDEPLGLDALPLGEVELPADEDEELGELGVAELPELELGLDGEVLDDEDELGELGLVALPDIEPDDEPLRFAGSADEPDEDEDAESPGRSQP
jgi:hypothetical protein